MYTISMYICISTLIERNKGAYLAYYCGCIYLTKFLHE